MKGETLSVPPEEAIRSPSIHRSPFTLRRSSFPALDLLLVFFILNLALQPLVEPDFGWHLRTGLDLLTQGWTMPATDPYSHTMPDWPWVEHAWLMDGLIGLLYERLGAAGPLAVILLFAAITAGAFGTAAGLAQVCPTYRLWAIAGALWVSLPFLGARTQMVTLLGLALLLHLYSLYLAGRLQRLWILPPLFLLWANLHGGVTAGLFVLVLVLVVAAALRLAVSRWASLGLAESLDEPIPTWEQIGHLALVILVSASATLLNPYGWRLYGEIYASLNDRFMIEVLHEWQQVSLQSQAGATYVGYLGLLGLALALFYRRVEPVRWSLLTFFLVQSLLHWRNVLFFVLLATPLWAELLAEATRRMSSLVPNVQRQKQALLGLTLVVALGMVWLGSDHLQRVIQAGLAPEEFFRSTEYPIEAVQWIKGHREQLGTKLYNDYGLGGFLLWWLPGEKIFIDGRMPAWRIGDRWIFYDYVALTAWDPPELRVLDKYGVDWAIVGKGTPLDLALAGHETWHVAYEDNKVTIFSR
ncbi:MAG: hypothetical protein HZA21_02535 [Nitrospirae bacterium]|nr:hypothetical protein [Nitrospirota bacterium]